MKVAFATGDLTTVNQQFRRATKLAVYELRPDGHHLVGVHTFAPDRISRTDERMEAIVGVGIVYGVAFLPSTVARLHERGIRAATAPSGTTIASLLAELGPRGDG